MNAFDDLTKPMPGWYFEFWRLLIHVNWAKTWTWESLSEDKQAKTTYVFAVTIVEKIEVHRRSSALSIVVGPLKLMVGRFI